MDSEAERRLKAAQHELQEARSNYARAEDRLIKAERAYGAASAAFDYVLRSQGTTTQ